MSQQVIASWQDRCIEVEQEIALVNEEAAAVNQQCAKVADNTKKLAVVAERESAAREKKSRDIASKIAACVSFRAATKIDGSPRRRLVGYGLASYGG